MSAAPTGFRQQTLADFVEQVGSSAPVPGGGSASAVTGALAAALVRMVVALSLGKPKFEPYQATLRHAEDVAARAAEHFLSLADEDAAAYAALAAAFKMPRATPSAETERQAAIHAAARRAALSPLEILRQSGAVAEAAEAIAGRSNVNARSDVSTAASLAEAAARGAAANVLINLPLVADETFAEGTSAETVRLLEEVELRAARARAAAALAELREPEIE